MSAAAWLVALLALPCARASAQETARDATSAVERWREALELDLPAEVLSEGPALVAPGGPLSAEGEALALVARALFEAGREGEARELLDGARPRDDTRVFVELERARQWLVADELERVVAALLADDPARAGTSVPRHPEQAASWILLGRALVRSGQEAQAAPCLRRYLELEPRGPDAYAALHMLSQLALKAGDGDAARALVERAQAVGQWRAYYRVRRLQVRERPDEPLPLLGLVQLWLQAGDAERAQEAATRLVTRFPAFAPGWFHEGEVRRARGDARAAEAAYSLALQLDPQLASARYNRAVLALQTGDVERARADFEALVAGPQAAEPRLLPAHLALARILLSAGEDEAAAARHARYRELGGSEPLAPAPPEERR